MLARREAGAVDKVVLMRAGHSHFSFSYIGRGDYKPPRAFQRQDTDIQPEMRFWRMHFIN